jgi:type IV pilus assembly protein PilV
MRRQSGFSMLEVLVAILVLAIGLLGMAGLTATSMRNSHGAYYRSQAVWLAYDIADRLRANRQTALAGGYNVAFTNPACAANTSPALNPGEDVTGWKNMVACALPAGDGSIAVDAASRQVTIIVQWNDTRASGGVAAQQFQVQTQL